MRDSKSILFVNPDYHCSFFYRDEFRKKGWKADIYVPSDYPKKLLYSNQDILRSPQLIKDSQSKIARVINHVLLFFWWLLRFWRYQYHVYYGSSQVVNCFEDKIKITKLFGRDFVFELFCAKLFKIKLIFLPSGCNQDESKEEFSKLDGGNVCDNCGSWNKCFDKQNNLRFAQVRRYFDMQIGIGSIESTQYPMTHMKYKSVNLDFWNEINIPPEHQLPVTKNLRILHSAYIEEAGRNWQGRNIKGSPYVLAAIQRLKEEGYPVEYYFIKDKPSNQMRFYQAQADIVVEQLIYGWWGSTMVETASLGKPVVCYLRPSWKASFLKKFPEYKDLPVIEADTNTIYEALKKLVTDKNYRHQKSLESRRFAEAHFDVVKNTKSFIKILEAL